MASHLQKQVEKQKQEAERKFSSWFINKFKKNKTQYIREQDERAAEAERLRRQKKPSSASLTASGSSSALSQSHSHSQSGSAKDGPSMQRQQSFLRAQLLEMKRHSHEVLLHAKSRGEELSSDEEYDEVHSVLGDDDGDENNQHHHNNNGTLPRPTSRARLRRARAASSDGNQSDHHATDDEDEEKKGHDRGEDTDGEDAHHHHRGSLRNSFTSTGGGSQRNSFTGGSGSQRNSISEEFERRSSRAALLYEEAISALEEVLHPDKPTTRVRRSDSATKRLFDKPENEWI